MTLPRSIKTSLVVTLLGATLSDTSALAQDARPEVIDALTAAKRSQPNLRYSIDPRTGLPSRLNNLDVRTNFVRSLGASRDSAKPPSEAAIKRAVEAFFARSQLRSAFPQGSASAKRVVKQVEPDPNLPGLYIATVKQEVAGIPVFGSSAKLTLNRALAVRSLSASFSALERIDLGGEITEAQAIATAKAELKKQISGRKKSFGLSSPISPDAIDRATPTATKTVFDPKLLKRGRTVTDATRLTWQVAIDSYRLFVDARTGKLLYSYRDHRSFTVRRIIDLGGKTELPDTVAINEETSARDKTISADAIRAYSNSGAVRDFFFAMFGRKSYDDGKLSKYGSAIVSYVRFGTGAAAHWCPEQGYGCPSANAAVYGAGYAGALDVVGHEFMHGVIAHETDLVYLEEAGAVNESLADIFGSLIELRTRGAGGNWVLGEDLPGFSIKAPLRSMSRPGLGDGSGPSLFNASADYDDATNRGQPSHYSDYVQRDDPLCRSTSDYDNGCVHFNSGIFNKFAHLIAEGGQHHGVTVQKIGRVKLGQLAYRAVRTKMTRTSGLQDASFAFIDACNDFANAKIDGFTDADCRQVENAQRAVGLNQPTG
ncbi:MAG: M4 family metallopeptidase [Hyphomicrobiaceae bacterium]